MAIMFSQILGGDPSQFQGSTTVTTAFDEACAPALSVIVNVMSYVPGLPKTCDTVANVELVVVLPSLHFHEYSVIQPFGDAEPTASNMIGLPT